MVMNGVEDVVEEFGWRRVVVVVVVVTSREEADSECSQATQAG